MRNLHCSGHFLRLLRSICAKTACARRAIVALFVVVATIIATFMIAPTYALSAGGAAGVNAGANTASTEKADGDKTGSTKTDVEQQPQSESNSAEPNKKNTGSSSTLTNNKESNPAKKQQPDSNNGVDKAKAEKFADETDAKQKAEGAKKKVASKKTALKMNRSAKKPKECSTLSECYKISYYNGNDLVKSNNPVEVKRGSAITITPKYELRRGKIPTTNLLDGLWFKLEDGEDPVPSWANFEKDNGATKVNDTSGDKAGFDGSVTLRPGKWDRGIHKFKIGIYNTADAKGKKIEVSVKIARSGSGDLTLNVYNHEDSDSTSQRSEIDDKTGITFKSGEDGNYSKITPIFIDSKSKEEPGYIHHHMICHKDGSGDSNENYTVDKVNGLSLSAKNSNSGIQTQFKHVENNKPSTGADAYAVYEKGDDSITERSQSWITGKPQAQSDGTFECKVFAVKDTKLIHIRNQHVAKEVKDSSVSDEFDENVKKGEYRKSLFNSKNPESNMVDSSLWTNSNDITKTIDWDYKTIKIVFKSKKKKQLEVKDGDLKLNVYPFKSNDAGSGSAAGGASAAAPSALGNNSTVSVMKGMELKPFIEATSEADSQKEINLKILCSKGEKPKESDASDAGGSGTKSIQSNTDLKYTKWVDPSRLGFNFPDNSQIKCTSSEGEQSCIPDGATTKFAARTYASAMFKSTEAGDYKCVVYALKKPDALNKFNDEATKTDVTPEKISTSFKGANLTANKDFAQLAFKIHVPEDFTLPHTGGQNWNLQLGAVAAVMVSVLAAGFVISQSEACRKLLYERRRC